MRTARALSALCLLSALACSGSAKTDGTPSDTDADAPTDTDQATTSDTDGGTDGGTDTDGAGGVDPTPVCGDGAVTGTEGCDDGGTDGGDGCSSACVIEPYSSCSGSPSICCTPIWGAGASVGAEDGEFKNDFGPLGSTTAWSAQSYSDGAGTPGKAFWTRSLSARSNGAYTSGLSAASSPTAYNGVAIFDSDLLDTDGVIGNFGGGLSPGPHYGGLISPRIDLTAHRTDHLALMVYSASRNFDIQELGVVFSYDDGATWSLSGSLPIGAVNAKMIEGFTTMDLGTIASPPADVTNARFAFIFRGNSYFAIVDDVTLQSCKAP